MAKIKNVLVVAIAGGAALLMAASPQSSPQPPVQRPVATEAPSPTPNKRVVLWRDVYVGEPRADIEARFPRFIDKGGKQKRVGYHDATYTQSNQAVPIRTDMEGNAICKALTIVVYYDKNGLAREVKLTTNGCDELADTLSEKYGRATMAGQKMVGMVWGKVIEVYPPRYWTKDGVQVVLDSDARTVTYSPIVTEVIKSGNI